ncbi:MAG: CBS domain-containing protein [Oscillatoriales cyanobacterium SM2_3_0]|nr:CBS domain-containing protein [Oscillatoriales cyanobacterium SM2_3_0]
MHLILCHTTVDFDALGAAVGLSRVYPGSRIVLTGGSHPPVQSFLALHRDEFSLIERRAIHPQQIQQLTIVDTQARDRLGTLADWLDLPQISGIEIWDHHPGCDSDIPATQTRIESVGATTTLVVEKLQELSAPLTAPEATVMALGIHVDTGSLTFDHTTVRDAQALTWLMEQGASLGVISDYLEPSLSPQLQNLLVIALNQFNQQIVQGFTISWIILETDDYVPGLSHLVTELIDLTESDAIWVGHHYQSKSQSKSQARNQAGTQAGTQAQRSGESFVESSSESSHENPEKLTTKLTTKKLTVIGRSRIKKTNLNQILKPWGGGGHEKAASAVLKEVNPGEILPQLVAALIAQIPPPPTAKDLMSSPVRTIRPQTTIATAHRILLRYGHSGLSVVNSQGQLVGIISRRDLDIALHHGFSHAPVKGYMTPQLKTITPETSLPDIEALMVNYDIGRLPVLAQDNLVGIVTRTDVLRCLHQQQQTPTGFAGCIPGVSCHSVQEIFQHRLAKPLLELIHQLAQLAQTRGWQLYLVGGGVRDLLLANSAENLLLTDLDMVVDGCDDSSAIPADHADSADLAPDPEALPQELSPPAVALAKALQRSYPAARLDIHGQFQTAALLWHNDPTFDSLWIDIATARTEFYPYPAANPEVEASSIRQDLYRRDFTINALALKLTPPDVGELLDFFGGVEDLQHRQIRVLHANSFIEDPTRIYRAVRFAVRLGFELEAQTRDYIHYAIHSGIYQQVKVGKSQSYNSNQNQNQTRRAPALETRLKSELKYILQAPYWNAALKLLGELKALQCIHPDLELTHALWQQIRLIHGYLRQFDSEQGLTHWQVRLEGLIADLVPEQRQPVAENLQLSSDSIARLAALASTKTAVVQALPSCTLPSQVVMALKPYDLASLILVAAQSPAAIRRKIRQYLTAWWQVKPLLNGNDLKQMGYKPGRQFKVMLDDLLRLTLDGEVGDRAAAIRCIQERYPL